VRECIQSYLVLVVLSFVFGAFSWHWVCWLVYGVVYQPGTPAFHTWGGAALVPAELMEAGLDFVILGILLRVFSKKQFDGQVALAYFILYSLARFGLEFLRTDSLMIGGLKAAQLTALITALIAAGLWLWQMHQTRQAALVR